MNMRPVGVLVLADGSVFEGELFGAAASGAGDHPGPAATSRFGTAAPPGGSPAAGEVVFNTAMSGYQEILTDPSYAGQIITFTSPHIGNYGVNATDFESARLFCRGVVVRELSRRPSNRRSEADLEAMLVRYGIPGITGVDTRRLTRLIRDSGAIPGAFGAADRFEELRIAATEEPGTDGIDLVATVTTPAPYTVGNGGFRIVAYDYGIKRTILRNLSGFGTVEVVPASTPAADVVARDPDGIFLSNGPGDPAEVAGATAILGELLATGIPIFGICLGNQLLGRALGGETVKLPFGHHGANHPVKDLTTGVIEITSQNHNFAVAIDSLAGVAALTHVNLNDGVCEGLAARDANAFSVQHHPEAGPGPHDSRYLFTRFLDRMTGYRGGRIPELFSQTAKTWPPHQRVEESGHGSEPVGLPQPAAGVG
jgi:carbamoyl-phosphate synthase small subunit